MLTTSHSFSLKKSIYFAFALLIPSSSNALSFAVQKAWYGNIKNKHDVTTVMQQHLGRNAKSYTIPANMNSFFNKPANGEKRMLHLTMKADAIDCSVMLTPGTTYTIDETFVKRAEKRQTLAQEIDDLSQQLRQKKSSEERFTINQKLDRLQEEKKQIEELMEPWRVQAAALALNKQSKPKAKKTVHPKIALRKGFKTKRVASRKKKDLAGLKRKLNKTKTPLKPKFA